MTTVAQLEAKREILEESIAPTQREIMSITVALRKLDDAIHSRFYQHKGETFAWCSTHPDMLDVGTLHIKPLSTGNFELWTRVLIPSAMSTVPASVGEYTYPDGFRIQCPADSQTGYFQYIGEYVELVDLFIANPSVTQEQVFRIGACEQAIERMRNGDLTEFIVAANRLIAESY